MTALLTLSRGIDAVTRWIGRGVSWMVLVAVLVSAGNAIVRKAFDLSSNAWLELQWYLFGAVFMLAAAWTLQNNEHIRVDIVSGRLKKRTRDWIDLIGHIVMLLPFLILMVWLLIPYVSLSYRSGEYSPNAGGLIVWPAKALLLAGFILLLAQAFSEIIKRAGVLFAGIPDPTPQQHPDPAADEMLATAPGEGAGAPATVHQEHVR
ncbi:TRAP transporter small permease subunit [Aurantimonas sp. MSK8Z-1]|uniref:TRAP transporter small permease subunit n=1 Tax=Mangrovibrevibacter kandeliae TaxID=2968473 RepID=UPI002118C3FA|nr:TRAP transporter small permease subunit [Aurantimonas sp. MSK8Z-1]MCW4113610.1 TRAP transporter small permease subunit [Aurantimonas sp. MSK8Z-1]